ncbi:hypothetical protein D3C73_1600900 [compost metagenome]
MRNQPLGIEGNHQSRQQQHQNDHVPAHPGKEPYLLNRDPGKVEEADQGAQVGQQEYGYDHRANAIASGLDHPFCRLG